MLSEQLRRLCASSSTMFVRELNPCFRSLRVSSLLLPSRRVLLTSLFSCVGKFLFSMLRTHHLYVDQNEYGVEIFHAHI
jgi:hypothetical protein